MADQLPNMVVIRRSNTNRYVGFVKDDEQRRGHLRANEESVFSHLAKIQVEMAGSDSRYVHLRFTHTNKYWGRRLNDRFFTATSDQPIEDLSNPACTLFQPNYNGTVFSFSHVQSRGVVNVEASTNLLVVADSHVAAAFIFTCVDWDTLVKLPTLVAFKAHNDRYLKGITVNTNPFLQVSSTDPNEDEASYEVQLMADGHVRIKSLHFNRYWRRSPNWIWADNNDVHGNNVDTLFWPVRIDDNIITLRNAGNRLFIRPLTADRNVDCLNAAATNMILETRLEVEELVLHRDIYNVRYRMEDARIYDEKPFLAGLATATNLTKEESSLAVSVAFEDSFSFSFSNSLSITTGVTNTFKAGIPKIASAGLEVSLEIDNTLEWGRTTTETKSVTAEYTVTVPAMSRARVSYVGTQGKCSVPFNYTRRDKRSVNGDMIVSNEFDGIYHGVNYYNFQFEVLETEAL